LLILLTLSLKDTFRPLRISIFLAILTISSALYQDKNMGVWYATYIGPYVRVPLHQVEDVKTRYVCSGNCGATGLTASTKFCPNCGKPVKTEETRKPAKRAARPWDLSDEFEELMWMPESAFSAAMAVGYVTWLPNRGGHGVTLSQDRDHTEVDISEAIRTQALLRFDAEYGAFVQAIEQQLGVKPEVCYGAIFYAN
jgi:hypothetical protein